MELYRFAGDTGVFANWEKDFRIAQGRVLAWTEEDNFEGLSFYADTDVMLEEYDKATEKVDPKKNDPKKNDPKKRDLTKPRSKVVAAKIRGCDLTALGLVLLQDPHIKQHYGLALQQSMTIKEADDLFTRLMWTCLRKP